MAFAKKVLPVAPYRQWTLSLPYDVRLRIGYDSKRVGDVLGLFLRTVFCWKRLQARRAGIDNPLTGAVTLCQRYGSILQSPPHFHSWLPDGVFSQDGDGVDKRPSTAGAFADRLAEVLDAHPPAGHIDCPGVFGSLTTMDTGDAWTFARVVND